VPLPQPDSHFRPFALVGERVRSYVPRTRKRGQHDALGSNRRSPGLGTVMSSASRDDGRVTADVATPRQRALGSLQLVTTGLEPAHRSWPGRHPIPPGRLADPRPLTRRLAQAIAEVLAGARPAAQLTEVATQEVVRLLRRSTGRLDVRPGVLQQRPVVGSVHVSEPCHGVAEACAVINTGARRRAIALRLEHSHGQWRCTALHVG
jgi:hypothetical protein